MTTQDTTARRTWFITGVGRGLGRAFATAALDAGDRVVGTARNVDELADLESSYADSFAALRLDVTVREDVFATMDAAWNTFGRLDVIVNNAGYGLVGALEEFSEAEARAQLETNFFGAMWVSQACLPYLREQGSGRIIQISTVGAVGTLPLFSMYNASKWALEGMSWALAEEVEGFGIQVTMAQLGGFDTGWGRNLRYASPVDEYRHLREAILGMPDYPAQSPAATETPEVETPAEPEAPVEESEWQDAPPEVAAAAILELAGEPNPPRRKIIGPTAHLMVRMALEARRDDYARDPQFAWPAAEAE